MDTFNIMNELAELNEALLNLKKSYFAKGFYEMPELRIQIHPNYLKKIRACKDHQLDLKFLSKSDYEFRGFPVIETANVKKVCNRHHRLMSFYFVELNVILSTDLKVGVFVVMKVGVSVETGVFDPL